MLTVEDCLKALARNKQKKRFVHKTKYGRTLEQKYGYDRKGHEEHYQRIKKTPYDMRTWEL